MFFIIFKGLSISKNHLRPESAPLIFTILGWFVNICVSNINIYILSKYIIKILSKYMLSIYYQNILSKHILSISSSFSQTFSSGNSNKLRESEICPKHWLNSLATSSFFSNILSFSVSIILESLRAPLLKNTACKFPRKVLSFRYLEIHWSIQTLLDDLMKQLNCVAFCDWQYL